MRILVVDDEVIVRELLRNVLTNHGYEVMEAENGLHGLHVAKYLPCDLVITDLNMPLLNGLNMISRLAAERYPARYLLISGGADREVCSALSFLSKPFTPSQLIDAVERLQQEPTLAQLEQAWRSAKREWRESVRETEEILSDVPSQIPHPDGALRIEHAALKRRISYAAYFQAFRRYKDGLQTCGVLGARSPKNRRQRADPKDSPH